MRIAVPRIGVEPDLGERLHDERLALRRAAPDLVHPEPFLDDLPDRHPRAEAAVRVLEDDLHLAAERAEGTGAERVDGPPEERDPSFARLELEHRESEGRLSRAALADHAHRLPLADLEGDSVYRADVAHGAPQDPAPDREPDLELFHLHRVVGVGRGGIGLSAGGRGEEVASVRMLRGVEYPAHRPGLDDASGVHDVDPVGHLLHDPEVMGDEEEGHSEPLPELPEELEDLGLDGHVERGGRLVGDEEVGVVREGHRDHDPLALSAGELVGVGGEAKLGIAEVDEFEQLEDPLAGRRGADRLVEAERFADLLLDRVEGIQRRHRLLEDHRYASPPERAHCRRGRVEEGFAVELDVPAGVPRLRVGKEPEDGQGSDRLAGPALPDESDRLAPAHFERDPANRLDRLAARAEAHVQVGDGEEGLRHAHPAPRRCGVAGRSAME